MFCSIEILFLTVLTKMRNLGIELDKSFWYISLEFWLCVLWFLENYITILITPNNFWNLLLDFATDSTTYCYHQIRPKLLTIISKIITQKTVSRHPSISNWLIRSSQIFNLTPMIGSCGGIPSEVFKVQHCSYWYIVSINQKKIGKNARDDTPTYRSVWPRQLPTEQCVINKWLATSESPLQGANFNLLWGRAPGQGGCETRLLVCFKFVG